MSGETETNVVLIGVISSIIATIIGSIATIILKKITDYFEYGKIAGHYNEFVLGREKSHFDSTEKPT